MDSNLDFIRMPGVLSPWHYCRSLPAISWWNVSRKALKTDAFPSDGRQQNIGACAGSLAVMTGNSLFPFSGDWASPSGTLCVSVPGRE